MERGKRETSASRTDKNKSSNRFFLKSDDFKLLILGALVLLIVRGVFQEIIYFAVDGGYYLGGGWQFLATIASGARMSTLFLVVDCSLLASAVIFILSFVVIAKNINNLVKSAVFLFFGTVVCIFASDFLYESDMDLLILKLLVFEITIIVLMFVLSCVALVGILTEKKNVETEKTKIRTLKELTGFCLQSKSFRLLLSLLLWLLMIGTVLARLIYLLPKLELMGVYEFLTYLVVSVLSSIFIFIGVLSVIRKVKKSFLSIAKLATVTIVFYLSYLFVFILLVTIHRPI